MLECMVINSMAKVFPDCELKEKPLKSGSALAGETYSLQLAYRSSAKIRKLQVEVASELKNIVRIRRVGMVPVECIPQHVLENKDPSASEYVRLKPGLFPDILFEDTDYIGACPQCWHTLWIDFKVPEKHKGGTFNIKFRINNGVDKKDPSFASAESGSFKFEIVSDRLPAQTLRHTEWFYTDCICNYYRIKPWSARHWELLEAYFKDFTAHGVNMLLTPIFTPPLDTLVGGERLTTQLVGVKKTKGKYSFNFSKLGKWIKLARKCGVKYFEFSHLFTQWGAKCTPKIVADVDGVEKKIFGWHVEAYTGEYKKFLDAFLPQLRSYITKQGIAGDSYFHVSDEPNHNFLENYCKASKLLEKHLKGLKMIDALSEVEFFRKGYVQLPVPSESHLHDFLEEKIDERWTYYCCGPDLPYSNRLHHMPAASNRIMGLLLYCYDVDGFLHWGFNFWNSGCSRSAIDPFRTGDSDWDYADGDAYLVAPGENGPLDTMRYEVFTAGLQDLRALRLLEAKIGREKVLKFIESKFGRRVTMADHPRSSEWISSFRDEVNRMIKKAK